MFKGIFKWISSRIKYLKMRRWMNDRATGTAVQMVVTGALHPPRFSGWWQK